MRTLTLLALSFVLAASGLSFTNNTPFHLCFESYNDTNVILRVHTTQTAEAPIEQWSVSWQEQQTVISNEVPVVASLPRQFFVVSASNEWGIVYSPPVKTEPPASPKLLRISKQ